MALRYFTTIQTVLVTVTATPTCRINTSPRLISTATDAHGRGHAYKTTPLRNPTTARQLENIDHCVIHFYEEANITHSPAGYPSINHTPAGKLPLTSSLNADPHARVTHR